MKVRLFSLLAFFLAFGLVATVVRSILPESGKYAWYLRQGQSSVESDKVVFIGSSHIYRQLDPDQFEKEIGAAAIERWKKATEEFDSGLARRKRKRIQPSSGSNASHCLWCSTWTESIYHY